jgi:xanthine dehydrogenase YagS FAD-binding subunit
MKAFEYAAPQTEAEVLDLLSSEPESTQLLAGGTDLIGLMKKMVLTPDRVVNIMDVESMQQIEPDPSGGLLIGAVVHLDELLDHPYLSDFPSILQAIDGINSMQLQAQGTIGGEVCQRPHCWFFRGGHGLLANRGASAAEGDNRYHAIFGNSGPAKFVSASRLAPALISLGAQVRILGPSAGQETILPLADFYRSPRHEGQHENVLLPNQLLTHIIVPPIDGRATATYEVRHGEGPDDPLATAAVTLRIDGGTVQEAQVVLGHVAPTPWISTDAAQALVGLPVTESTAHQAGEAAVALATPLADNEYKVQLAQVAVKRAILRAAGLETGGF